MNKLMIKSVVIFFIIYLTGCESSSEPDVQKELVPYMSLNVGDIRQYYSPTDGVYFQYEIVGTTYRTDGQMVYVMDEYVIPPDLWVFKSTSYYFIRDNFFICTELDTVLDERKYEGLFQWNNEKIYEMKGAQIFPINGDSFYRTEEVADSQKALFKVSFVDSVNTNCGVFKDVVQYEVVESDSTNRAWIYYAPFWGHIGTITETSQGRFGLFVSYIKVGDMEIGEYTPFNLNKKNQPDQKKKTNLFANLFGE